MKSNICDENNKLLNFPINIQTNKEKDALNTSAEQSRTTIDPGKNDSSHCKYSSCVDSNSNINLISNNNINYNLKFLIKYKNIYVPKIFLINYNDANQYPPKGIINNSQNINPNGFNIYSFLFPFSFSSYQNNSEYKDYLNYGYNFDQWKKYATDIRNKFDELNDLVEKSKIKLPEPYNELDYLMSLPSDFGGLGNLYNEHEYENVKFYDPKNPENKNKNIMKEIKFERKMKWFNLNPNTESITKNIKLNPFQMNFLSQQYLCSLNNNKIKDNKEKNTNNKINSEDKKNENSQNDEKSETRIKEKHIKKESSKDKRKNRSRSQSRSINKNKRRQNNRKNEYEEKPYRYRNEYHKYGKYNYRENHRDVRQYFSKYGKRSSNFQKNYYY